MRYNLESENTAADIVSEFIDLTVLLDKQCNLIWNPINFQELWIITPSQTASQRYHKIKRWIRQEISHNKIIYRCTA